VTVCHFIQTSPINERTVTATETPRKHPGPIQSLPNRTVMVSVVTCRHHVGRRERYVSQGFNQGRVSRLSPGKDPCPHRAASDPHGDGDLHVQLRSMRSYHIQSRRTAAGRKCAKHSKQGPAPHPEPPGWLMAIRRGGDPWEARSCIISGGALG
jgi:hypothetical protein